MSRPLSDTLTATGPEAGVFRKALYTYPSISVYVIASRALHVRPTVYVYASQAVILCRFWSALPETSSYITVE